MEPANRSSSGMSDALCAECERVSASGLFSRTGASLCASCVEAYYVACSGCSGLLPKDESITRGELAYCAECFARPAAETGAASSGDLDTQSLISEYVALHAEEKRIGKRMSEIKESLKAIAASQQRSGNAVTLRANDVAVRCSYRVSLKCDAQIVEALEQVLDKEEFTQLFERRTSFNAIEDKVREFLSSDDATHNDARELLRTAVRETETVTLNVVSDRR